MAIHRGIQSAIFYYLSCAPCAEARYRRKRKEEAARGRVEREALHAEMPHLYRHPSPSSTNPHWHTEISAGPALSSRGKRRTNNTADASHKNLKTSMTQVSNDSNIPSSVDLSLRSRGSRDGRNDSKFNFKQYQREDEETWSGAPVGTFSDVGSLNGSGISRPQRARTRDSANDRSYDGYKNPPLNDLHPATVTRIRSREEAKWLMAPPPTADFMSGRDLGQRSRSDSGGSSRLSARSAAPLSREMSQKMIERRLRSGEVPTAPSMSRESSLQTAEDPNGQRHDRSRVEERDFAEESTREVLRRLPVQIQASEDSSNSERTIVHSPDLAPEALQPRQTRKLASRPQLSTILSDNTALPDHDGRLSVPSTRLRENSSPSRQHSDDSTDRDRISRRSALATIDDSLKVLQDLAPGSAILKTQVVSSEDLRLGSRSTKSRHPSTHDANAEIIPGLFDSWYTADFALPEWIHEHTKREVKERWSMDI